MVIKCSGLVVNLCANDCKEKCDKRGCENYMCGDHSYALFRAVLCWDCYNSDDLISIVHNWILGE